MAEPLFEAMPLFMAEPLFEAEPLFMAEPLFEAEPLVKLCLDLQPKQPA